MDVKPIHLVLYSMSATDFIFHQNYLLAPKKSVCYVLPLSGFFSSRYSQHAGTFGFSSVYHFTVSLIFLIYTVYFIIASELLSNTASCENTYSVRYIQKTYRQTCRKKCRQKYQPLGPHANMSPQWLSCG